MDRTVVMDKENLSIINNENKNVDNTTKKYNKSAYFLLPMLDLSIGINFEKLINSYIGDSNLDTEENYYIYLLMKELDINMEYINGYSCKYKVNNGIMYKYRIPNKYEEDYLKFILGKYSEFSNEYKNQIYKLLNKPYRDTNIYKVLNKTADAKKKLEEKIGESIGDQEVMSIPSFIDEYYEK